jgi:excisionase family DNA binding protein
MSTILYAPDDDLLTKEGLAQWLGVSVRKIEYMMANENLPFLRLGHRTVRFRRCDVIRHLMDTGLSDQSQK